MFDQLVVSGPRGAKTNKPWTVAVSAGVQILILFVLVLIPLIYTEALPKGFSATFLTAPPPPPPPPPPPAVVKTVKAPKIVQISKMVAPTVIPKTISIVKDDAPVIYSNNDAGVPGGTGGGILGGILGNSAPPPPKPAAPQRIKVGGQVEQGAILNRTTPEYPQIAKVAHISGTVVLHAIIAKDGTIQELQYISGPPMLMKSAMDAVKQWRYKPYLLNGDPVEVETTINVDFSFGG